jgi:dihydroxyacetone kinase-like protein
MDIPLTRAWVQATAAAMDKEKDHLTQLDSAIGDADHGVNMQRGFTAVLAALDGYEPAGVGDVLVKTGTTLISKVGGAAGPLYGTFFRAAGKQLTGPTADAEQLAAAFDAGLAGVQKLGAAVPGDKTMVDALVPALEAFGEAVRAGESEAEAARKAAAAAETGMQATVPLQARKGRASYLGARSVGHQDPGATSTALLFRALAEVLTS